jgi:anaerobic magnesium-protoporphyrin IX monomethyl ester cyclase
MRILLVTIDHLAHLNIFPMGVAYIAAVARQDGHEVEIWNQELYHFEDSEIQTYLDMM